MIQPSRLADGEFFNSLLKDRKKDEFGVDGMEDAGA
jgi:hypothetical protein